MDLASEAGPGIVSGEPIMQEPGRALLGWLTDEEGVRIILGRNPAPNEDTQAVRDAVVARRAAVAARQPFAPEDAVEEIDTPELQAIAARQQVQSYFAPHASWTIARVRLSAVLAFQKAIRVAGLEDRLAGVMANRDLLTEFCLPSEQPQPPTGALTDGDGKGFTVSSLNPNLRIASGLVTGIQAAPGPGLQPMPMQGLVILVHMGASYLQVAEYNGRFFLRDGYHRAAGLLRADIDTVPAVLIHAQTFDEVLAGVQGFGYETLFGDRPPRLSDFWDDRVAADSLQAAVRKVIRVRGDEFVVQV